MKTPRKIYLVVSRTFKGDAEGQDVCFRRGEADEESARRNRTAGTGDPADWRVETFVKGD